MRIVCSVGGTGGHLFPAQRVAEELGAQVEVWFAGEGLGHSPFFQRDRFYYQDIPSAPLSLNRIVQGSTRLFYGVTLALSWLRKIQPKLVVGFGSYHAAPVLAAASLLRIPIILYEQNIIAGRVNRLFSYMSQENLVYFEPTKIRGKKHVVPFPIRSTSDENSWEYFGWQPGKKTWLIFGGSQGARRLNEVALQTPWKDIRLIHLVGNTEQEKSIRQHYEQHHIEACVKSFEPHMAHAFRVADGVICRAGASTLGELIHYRKPAILIPYPYAQDDHQWLNGSYFVHTLGGGQLFRERALDPKTIVDAISEMNLEKCSANLQQYGECRSTVSVRSIVERYL